MNPLNQEQLQNDLKIKRICRFCLCQHSRKLSSIYMRDTRIKTSAPLPIQIMAIASIEVFTNDGMPSYICTDCTKYFEFSYQFKQMCKKADNSLRQFPLTGKWPSELDKPLLPQSDEKALAHPTKSKTSGDARKNQTQYAYKPQNGRDVDRRTFDSNNGKRNSGDMVNASSSSPKIVLNASQKKILNSEASINPEPPVPLRPKVENIEHEAAKIFLNKIENDDELLIDDVQRLVACENEEIEEVEFVNMNSLAMVVLDPANESYKPTTTITPITASPNTTSNNKPKKLLNKSSVRILNKDANKNIEPRLSLPKVKQDEEGNVEIVAEILESDEPYEDEPDPKDAAPIEVHVFPCPHCQRSFPLRQLRDIHVKNHSRERNFICKDCGKRFFSKYDLQKHSLTHSDDKPYKCSACDKSFTRGTLLYRHERTHIDLPKYICVHCEKPFLSTEDLNKHVERHTKHRPFQCKLCHKAFAFKQGLERHEVVHSRQQPYPCQYCDQSFSTTSKLARHLTAHAGDRPYPCKFCPKSYLLSHHLTRHLRSHKNATAHSTVGFNCNICHETFDSRELLISHSGKHATDDSLVCPLCKECFDNLEQVTSHIQDHSYGEAYACEFCDLIFLSSEKLNGHIQINHADDMVAYHEHENEKIQTIEHMASSPKRNCNTKNQPEKNSKQIDTKVEAMEVCDGFQDTLNSFMLNVFNDTVSFKKESAADPQESQLGAVPTSEKLSKRTLLQNKMNKQKANATNNINKNEDRNDDFIPLKMRKMAKSRNSSIINTTTASARTMKAATSKSTPATLMQRCETSISSTPKGGNMSLLKRNNIEKNEEETTQKVLLLNVSKKYSANAAKQSGQISLLQKSNIPPSPTTLNADNNKETVEMITIEKNPGNSQEHENQLTLKDGKLILIKCPNDYKRRSIKYLKNT